MYIKYALSCTPKINYPLRELHLYKVLEEVCIFRQVPLSDQNVYLLLCGRLTYDAENSRTLPNTIRILFCALSKKKLECVRKVRAHVSCFIYNKEVTTES